MDEACNGGAAGGVQEGEVVCEDWIYDLCWEEGVFPRYGPKLRRVMFKLWVQARS